MYTQVLKNIPEEDKETARSILFWLTYSIRPLTLRELASAVKIPSPQKVLDICTSSLISLQPNDFFFQRDVVKFDHFSVKEFLTSENFRTSPETRFFYVSPLIAHLTMAEISVSRFININNFDLATGKSTRANLAEKSDTESWLPGKDPLLRYSRLWYKHVQQADAIDRVEAQSAETQQNSSVSRVQSHRLFCEDFSQGFQNWLRILWEEHHNFDGISMIEYGESTSPIIMATLAGLPNNVRRLLDNGADIREDVRNVNFDKYSVFAPLKITRPIQAAAISGNLEILRLLLDHGATLNQSDLDMVALKNSQQGADVLLEIFRDQPNLKITDKTLVASARNWGSKEMLSYILDHENHLTQPQIIAIAKKCRFNSQNDDVIEKIMSYGERIDCDKNEMLIAFLRWSQCGSQIRTVLDRYQPPNRMTNLILQSVIQNVRGRSQMRQSVMEYYRDGSVDIHISPDLLDEIRKLDDPMSVISIIINYAKTVIVEIKTLQRLGQTSNDLMLMNVFMNRGNCECDADLYHSQYLFGQHLSTCRVKVTSTTMRLAAQLDKLALETLRKNARPNVIFPSADEIKALMEKRRSGTPQQIESNLSRMQSPEPATVAQSEDS